MGADNTFDAIVRKYHTITRRPNLNDTASIETLFKSLNRGIRKNLPERKDAPILDVGCGEGGLLLYLKHNGFRQLHGFDLSEENVSICHELGLSFVSQWNALDVGSYQPSVGKFSAIFAFDLIEHIHKEDVTRFLAACRERLEDGGELILRTPNMGSFLGWHMRYYDLTHEFGVSEKSVVDLCVASGFETGKITVLPDWNATSPLGHLRELHLRLLHRIIFLAEDSSRPKISTKNLLILARR